MDPGTCSQRQYRVPTGFVSPGVAHRICAALPPFSRFPQRSSPPLSSLDLLPTPFLSRPSPGPHGLHPRRSECRGKTANPNTIHTQTPAPELLGFGNVHNAEEGKGKHDESGGPGTWPMGIFGRGGPFICFGYFGVWVWRGDFVANLEPARAGAWGGGTFLLFFRESGIRGRGSTFTRGEVLTALGKEKARKREGKKKGFWVIVLGCGVTT